MPRGHCKQPSRPTSASYLVPAATHEKASKMIPTTTQAQPTSPHAAEHLSEKQHQHCTDVKNPPSTHEIQHTEDICTAVEPARNESIAATTEAIPKAKADRDPLPANKAAPMCAATAAITVAASDAQCSQAASTQPAQMLPLPSKRQWVPAPNLTPLPAWPEGPPQHAKGSATPWTASQSEFGMSQASLGFNPALSFGKQPCAVMW